MATINGMSSNLPGTGVPVHRDGGFSNVAGELRYDIVNGNTPTANGDGVADFMIRVIGSHALTERNLII